jgi:hypothetical protein
MQHANAGDIRETALQVCRGDRFAQEDFRGRLRGLVGDITLDWRYTRTGLALSEGQAVEVAK